MKLAWLLVLLTASFGAGLEEGPTQADNVGAVGDPTRGLIDTARASGIRPLVENGPDTFFYRFTRGGQFRESLVLLPRAVFETDLIDVGRGRCVSLMAGIPFNLGDGAILEISAEGISGQPQVVRVSLDPAHVRADRTWTPIRLDIPANEGPISGVPASGV
jgi:hypothetical protein